MAPVLVSFNEAEFVRHQAHDDEIETHTVNIHGYEELRVTACDSAPGSVNPDRSDVGDRPEYYDPMPKDNHR